MKGTLIIAAIAIFISGCSTTPNNMRSSGPDEVHTSFKEAKEVSLCIGQSWENLAVVSSRETDSGYALTGLIGGRLHYLADIENNPKGSQIKLYKFMSQSIGRDPLFGGAVKCL